MYIIIVRKWRQLLFHDVSAYWPRNHATLYHALLAFRNGDEVSVILLPVLPYIPILQLRYKLVHLWSRATAAKVNIWQFFAWNCVVQVADTGAIAWKQRKGRKEKRTKIRREDYKGNWRVKPEPVSTWTTTLEMVIGRYCSAKWRVRTGWYNSAEENDFTGKRKVRKVRTKHFSPSNPCFRVDQSGSLIRVYDKRLFFMWFYFIAFFEKIENDRT